MTKPISHSRSVPRRDIQLAATESASRIFDELEHGTEMLVMTHGQFSLIDALWALLRRPGPADVSIATWTAAGADVTRASQFLNDGRVRRMRWLVDRSFEKRQPAYCATLRGLFGDDAIRTTDTHAKFATIRNDEWDLAIRTSMNLNSNARMETIEVSDDPSLADFLDSVFGERFANQPPGEMNGELSPLRAVASLLDPTGSDAQALDNILAGAASAGGTSVAGGKASGRLSRRHGPRGPTTPTGHPALTSWTGRGSTQTQRPMRPSSGGRSCPSSHRCRSRGSWLPPGSPRPTCSQIRSGRYLPHPRHWDALRGAVVDPEAGPALGGVPDSGVLSLRATQRLAEDG